MRLSEFTNKTAVGDLAFVNLFLAKLFETTPIMDHLQFYPMTGAADSQPKDGTASGIGTKRTLNNDYEGKEGTVNYGNATLQIFGDKLKLDIAYQDRGGDVRNERARQLEKYAPNFGKYLTDQIFNGTGANGDMNGINSLMPASRIVNLGGDNGLQIITGKSDEALLSQDQLITAMTSRVEAVDGGCELIAMSGRAISMLWSIASHRMSTIAMTDVFGNTHNIKTFDGIPILNAGFKNDNSGLVIPNNQTVGESTDCTSMYFLKFGEKENLTAMTNIGMKVKDLGQIGVQYVTFVELETNLMLLNDNAITRLDGIRLPNLY